MRDRNEITQEINMYIDEASPKVWDCIGELIKIEKKEQEEDLKKKVVRVLDAIENAQEDCANLGWVSKDQAKNIIKMIMEGKDD